MRIVATFALLIVFRLGGNAQEFRIGLVGQPCLTYYTIQSDNSSLSLNFKQQNKPLLSYQIGGMVFREINPNVVFVGGLVYAQRGMKSQFNTSNISAFNFGGNGYELKIVDRYLEIPLSFLFYFHRKEKFSWFVIAGLKPALYINSVSKSSGTTSAANRFYYDAHRRINVFVSMGVGAEITMSDRWGILIWPTLEHAVISEVYASPLKLYPYSLGMNLCLAYSLGN